MVTFKFSRAAFFIKHLRWLPLQMLCFTLYFQKDVVVYCSYTLHNCFILKPKINLIRFHLLSFVVPYVVTRCTTRCYSLSLVVSHCHSLSLVVIRCHSLHHSLSFIRCHSLSLAVTRCTTRLSFYKRSAQKTQNRIKNTDVWILSWRYNDFVFAICLWLTFVVCLSSGFTRSHKEYSRRKLKIWSESWEDPVWKSSFVV